MNSSKSIYLLFSGQGRHFMRRILKKGFTHIEVYMADTNEWLTINPTQSVLDVHRTGLPTKLDLVSTFKKRIETRDMSILKVTYKTNRNIFHKFRFFNLVSCVTIVKYLLGVAVRRHTPYSLYIWLKNMALTRKFKESILNVEILKEGKHV